MELGQIDAQLRELYRSLSIPLDESGSLKALDSLGLIHLIDRIENHFTIRIQLVDLHPSRIARHDGLVEIIAKYVKRANPGSHHATI